MLNRVGQATLAAGVSKLSGKCMSFVVTDDIFNGHKVVLDKEGKIIP